MAVRKIETSVRSVREIASMAPRLSAGAPGRLRARASSPHDLRPHGGRSMLKPIPAGRRLRLRLRLCLGLCLGMGLGLIFLTPSPSPAEPKPARRVAFDQQLIQVLSERDTAAARLFAAGVAASDRGDYAGAAAFYQSVRERAPWFVHATRRVGAMEMQLGHRD